MDSFEDLGISAELVESLAAEGIERPTPLQAAALPVVGKGKNLLLAAGPGSGLLVTWAPALLDRCAEHDGEGPALLVLTGSEESADRLAESLARLCSVSGHAVAALGSPWVFPERAHVVLGTPADVLSRAASGKLSLAGVIALVVDQAQLIEQSGGLGAVEQVIDYLPASAQRIVSALPVTAGVSDLVDRHFRRALTLPAPDAVSPLARGRVRFRIVGEPREAAALAVASELLPEHARHLLVYCRSEDRAADLGDYLTLHGYVAGAPGDPSAPVWLGVDALEARAAARGVEGVVVVSVDVPTDPDELDRRHGIGDEGVALILPRETPHFKSLGKRTGYETVPFPPPARSARTDAELLRAEVERAIADEDTAAYLSILEPLFERFDPAEVAAAAVALLRSRRGTPGSVTAPPAVSTRAPEAAPSWAKLFIGVGERDGLRPGDLLGAITGEAGVDGRAVGKIEIRESHSLVEVHDTVARQVIDSINGTTIRGRAVRADFDRPRRPGPTRAPGRSRPPR